MSYDLISLVTICPNPEQSNHLTSYFSVFQSYNTLFTLVITVPLSFPLSLCKLKMNKRSMRLIIIISMLIYRLNFSKKKKSRDLRNEMWSERARNARTPLWRIEREGRRETSTQTPYNYATRNISLFSIRFRSIIRPGCVGQAVFTVSHVFVP